MSGLNISEAVKKTYPNACARIAEECGCVCIMNDGHDGAGMTLCMHGNRMPCATDDEIHHPTHYTSHPSGVEAIDVGRHLTADWFNAFKYVFRADLKNGKQDLEKALWYVNDALTHDLPVHARSWRFKHQLLLTKIIDAEVNDVRRSFFKAMNMADRVAAKACIEVMIQEWPS